MGFIATRDLDRKFQFGELVLFLSTIIYCYFLREYKQDLNHVLKNDDLNALERAFKVVNYQHYSLYLILGVIVIALLVGYTIWMLRKMTHYTKWIFFFINIVLLIIVLVIFYDPILTSFAIVAGGGSFILYIAQTQ